MVPEHEVRVGDALRLLCDLPDGHVDAVITDPPYSSGGMVRGDRTQSDAVTKYISTGSSLASSVESFTGDNRDQRSYAFWCSLWLAEARRATKPGGSCVVFTDWRQMPTVTDAVQAGGWVWRGLAVWDKGRGRTRPNKGGFWNQSEYLVWGTNGPRDVGDDDPCLPGVFRTPAPSTRERVHLTEKPVALLRELMLLAPRDGLVLDPFCGAGSTGAAALQTGRRFLGFEMSSHFAELASSVDRVDIPLFAG